MEKTQLKNIVEAALLASGQALKIDALLALFEEKEKPSRKDIREALDELAADCEQRGIELKEIASGYRLQVKEDYSTWISRLWDERPARYSRALLETLALIAYRQPTTRAEIEEVRGVSVSSSIMKTLLEREWIRIVGHREVPGRPALYGTTRQFLDYFGLKSLGDLPELAQITDLDASAQQLDLAIQADADAADAAGASVATLETAAAADSGEDPADETLDSLVVGEEHTS